MRRNRARRPSPALVVASLALFAALSGVGYAAINLAPASVKSEHVARDAVKHRHIARNAVRRSDIARRSVTSDKVADRSLKSVDLAGDSLYAAYLQPHGDTSSITVGWETYTEIDPTLTYDGPGRYTISFARGTGLGCAVPTAVPLVGAAGVSFRVVGLACNATRTWFELATSNGQDAQIMLQVAFSR